MLQVTDLQFGYESTLVSGLSFSISAGAIRLLHGPSGCGKSSLLGILSGTADPRLNWRGQMTLSGVDIGAGRVISLMSSPYYQPCLGLQPLSALALNRYQQALIIFSTYQKPYKHKPWSSCPLPVLQFTPLYAV